MKVALILPNNLFRCPYIYYYLNILDTINIEYTIYNWDRTGKKEDNCISYCSSKESRKTWRLLIEFFKFRKFIKSHLNNNDYDKVIVFSCQIAILLSTFLLKKFKHKYLIDIRDYSKVISYFRSTFDKVLHNAELICISSRGFTTWLPEDINYIVSHNLNADLLQKSIDKSTFFQSSTINVDTIGALRDHQTNSNVIDALKNNEKFFMKFIGDGYALPILKEKAANDNINNIYFHGFYKKEEEFDLLKTADFINIMVDNDFLSKGLTSNRLYLCALYKIPAIVSSQTEQSRIIEKYKFGIVIDDFSQLSKALIAYSQNFNNHNFISNCNTFLSDIKKDQDIFETRVQNFSQST